MIVIFKQDKINVYHNHNDNIIRNMSFNQFVDICNRCWKENMDSLWLVKKII